jgi:OmcA/MtrC family decaheme c-type cytochrome
VVLLLCAAFAAYGCSNDGSDGSPGAEGAQGPPGDTGPPGPPGPPSDFDPSVALEACIGCHAETAQKPVGDITNVLDSHYIDTDPQGPETTSGYRQLHVQIDSVDVSRLVDNNSVLIDFTVTDENGSLVTDLFNTDGRFTIARLSAGAMPGDASYWRSFITRLDGAAVQANSESFTSAGFQANTPSSGHYRYASTFNPANAPSGMTPIASGETLRVAIQLSAGDLPAGNGWCDFDANLAGPNTNCNSASRHRDIVQTATCNGCHGVTSDVHLALHGGGRTQVEYCVTCHNPYTTDGQTGNTVDFKVMIHKIHDGANLTNGYQIIGFNNSLNDFSYVEFTKDIDNCAVCHTGGGVNVSNWNTVPTREACGSCHDDVNFTTGANHGKGGVQLTNGTCATCHPSSGALGAPDADGTRNPPQPIQTVHEGAFRNAEGALYSGGANGYKIDNLSYASSSRVLTIDFHVTRNGSNMTLESAPQWTASGGASRLGIDVGFPTTDYTNAGSGSNPAQPITVNALNVGGAVTALGGGLYRTTATLPSGTSGTAAVAIEGHPAADLDGDGVYSDRIAVKSAVSFVSLGTGRAAGAVPRRQVVDINKCQKCHDEAGNGISLHGSNRTGTEQVCVICHNPNDTDVNRRPTPPAVGIDGKAEVPIDFKRMIHMIHSGGELEDPLVVYGFGGSPTDFSHVDFIGNRQNCETCHLPGTYDVEDAFDALPTTVDTGADKSISTDDLNISPVAAVCSACHDTEAALDHMKLHGASFHALDADIN